MKYFQMLCKIEKVYKSCKTTEQLKVANNYAKRCIEQYKTFHDLHQNALAPVDLHFDVIRGKEFINKLQRLHNERIRHRETFTQ